MAKNREKDGIAYKERSGIECLEILKTPNKNNKRNMKIQRKRKLRVRKFRKWKD